MKYIFFLFLFVALSIKGLSQPITSNSFERMVETAVNAAMNGDYVTAIEYFDKAYKEKKDPDFQVAIADMHMLLREYNKAEKLYERVLKRDKRDEYFDVRLDYARALKAQGKYKEALEELNNFTSMTESDSLKLLAKSEAKGILLLEKLPENLEVSVRHAGDQVNSPGAETSPVFGPNGTLYFGSMMQKAPVVLDGEEGEYHTKIYTSQRDPEKIFGKPEALPEIINRVGYYNSDISFSKDGNTMYFVRSKLNANKIKSAEIFRSKWSGSSWGAPQPIDALNNEYLSKHPIEGELFGTSVLFYISNMPGGYGGFDIYYVPIQGNDFGSPTNLGSVINSTLDEVSPFYYNGKLYFSSNGHPGIGGLDIFSSNWDGSRWSAPENLGYNYNSSTDDFFFKLNDSGSVGVLVSNRQDTQKAKFRGSDMSCDDIYLVQIRDVMITLIVDVNNDNGPLPGASVELYEGNAKIPVETKINPLGHDVKLSLDPNKSYKAIVIRDGYFPDTITFNTNGIFDDYSFNKKVILTSKPEITRTVKRNEPILLRSIYFDYDDDTILSDAEPSLSYIKSLMNKYPDMIIELSSHTDSRGKAEYNKNLSQRRANSTKKWLVTEGIAASRIRAVGYGESQLLNKCKDGVKCSEEEHQLNRRSEFKIVAGPQTIEIVEESLK